MFAALRPVPHAMGCRARRVLDRCPHTCPHACMGIILRVELPEGDDHPLRVRVQREDEGVDYGWVRVDELTHLIAAMTSPGQTGPGG